MVIFFFIICLSLNTAYNMYYVNQIDTAVWKG